LHTLRITGDVTILCETAFAMRDGGRIELDPGATLTIYTKGLVEIVDSTAPTNSFEPGRFRLFHLGESDINIGDGATFYAAIVAPYAGLRVADTGDFYGTYTGRTLNVENVAGFHLDDRMSLDACGEQLADTAGLPGVKSTGGITSALTFRQWYRDVMGVNLSAPHSIALVRGLDGVYEFSESEFHPIDGRLFGNEGAAHNYHFTYAVSARFTYEACTDQFVELVGSDDIWLFIDGWLAIDLGGMLANQMQHIDLDRLGLADGNEYSFRLFFAQRQSARSSLTLRTNVPFRGRELVAVSAGFD
jgi:fibro-slime domain-containing protein